MKDTYILSKKDFQPLANRLKKTLKEWDKIDVPDNVLLDYLWDNWVDVLVGCYVDDLDIDPRSMKYRRIVKDMEGERRMPI